MGSGATLIRKSDVDQLKIKWEPATGKNSVIGYGAGVVEPLGNFKGNLEIDGIEVEVDILVVPDTVQTVPLLVGHQYTEQKHIRIISDANGLVIESGEPYSDDTPRRKYALVSTNSSIIPKNYVGYMEVHADIAYKELCVEGSMRETGEMIPRCLIKLNECGNAVVPVLNLSTSELKINKDQTLARGEICRPGMETQSECRNEEVVVTEEHINTELCGEDKEELLHLLNKHSRVVAFSTSQLGKTNKAEMHIIVNDDVPVYFRPYRLPQAEREKVKNIVEELKDGDIIEDSV